jgi:hypothetical protein
MSKVHIVFGVYKRTTYFKKCIDSIKNQITHHDVSLVIDGPNDDPGVIENINLFIDTFKHKYNKIEDRIFSSETNIGPEYNIIKCFKVGFETSDCDYIIFIEDDIELNPIYLEQMKSLWEFVKNYDEIATFSCYSRDCLDLHDNELELYNNHLLTQYHQYGTGIKRKYYDDLLKHLIEEYTSHTEPGMINDSYKKIETVFNNKYELYSNPEKTHWDIFYASISYKFGYFRVSTCLNYCKHIGVNGFDCTYDLYHNMFKKLEDEKFNGKTLIYNFIFDKNLNKYNDMIKKNIKNND